MAGLQLRTPWLMVVVVAAALLVSMVGPEPIASFAPLVAAAYLLFELVRQVTRHLFRRRRSGSG